ncbi:aminotransferase class I/II-fold pyridoxal phosphate-dependent enzyme [Thermus hydrothermalis]
MSRVPEPSVFLVVDEAKRRARERGVELIDLSIGSTDLLPPEAPLKALQEALLDPRTYGYCLKSCTLPFLEAATTWYQGRYGVALDPRREALALIGSQEGLAHLLLALTEPGDLLLLPEVAYPSYFGAARVASLRTHLIPLGPGGLAELKRVPEPVLKEAKVLLLNYPNNPTGAVADWGYFEKALALAKRYGLWFLHDNPYVDQVYEGEAPSPLALPGAKERVVELFSLSKSYNLAGFRLGFALGNAEAIERLERVKGVIDFNQYAGILRLGIAALQTPREATRGYAQVYRERALGMARALEGALELLPPRATMYLWGNSKLAPPAYPA